MDPVCADRNAGLAAAFGLNPAWTAEPVTQIGSVIIVVEPDGRRPSPIPPAWGGRGANRLAFAGVEDHRITQQ